MASQKVASYKLTWLTPSLAVGYAPMSYDQLDAIKAQGIDAIVNLCGEFCDLHDIERDSGFEVFYLPIPDDDAPDMERMEQALEWLDESLYLGKKVLVHCRHGIGRTGTFVTAYMLRKGFSPKVAEKRLKHTTAHPSHYRQWKLLRQYGKQAPPLTIREPSLESAHAVDLAPYLGTCEAMIKETLAAAKTGDALPCPAEGNEGCCRGYFELTLIETVAVSQAMNRQFDAATRHQVIGEAADLSRQAGRLRRENGPGGDFPARYAAAALVCPLARDGGCLILEQRPLRCRLYGLGLSAERLASLREDLALLSGQLFHALTGDLPRSETLTFPWPEVVSGRFVQRYFHYLAGKSREMAEGFRP